MRCRFLYCVSALVDLFRWMTYVEMEAITMLQFAAGVGLFCAFVVFYFYIRRNGHSKVRIVLWRPSCFWYCINMPEFNR